MSNCPKQTISTDSELNDVFGDATHVGVLPVNPNGSSERDEKGALLQNTLTTILIHLRKTGIIPSPTKDTPDVLIQKQTALIKSLPLEYCFYESRYKYALEKVFNAIRNGYLSDTEDTKAIVKRYLDITKMLHMRLQDLTQITSMITENMVSSSTGIQKEIETYNKQIQAQRVQLEKQSKIINKGEAVTNIRKEMIKYTEEKAKYTDNLLTLYSFLNIVTLGLLVYIYKAAGNE